VVQGSAVTGEVGATLDDMGVVAGPSSDSGVPPTRKSPSASHSNHDNGLYHGRDFLVDSNEEAPLPWLTNNKCWSSFIYKMGEGIMEIGYPGVWKNYYNSYAIMHREKEQKILARKSTMKVVSMQ